MSQQPPSSGRVWLVFVAMTLVGMGIFGRILIIQHWEHDRWAARAQEFFSHSEDH